MSEPVVWQPRVVGSAGQADGPPDRPGWMLVDEGFTLAREHELESVLAASNGYAGVRASLAERCSLSRPATFLAGTFAIFEREGTISVPELMKPPDWTHLAVQVDHHPLHMEGDGTLHHRRALDMREGTLWRQWTFRTPEGRVTDLCFRRLASLADRHVLLQSLRLTAENHGSPIRLESRLAPLAPSWDLAVQALPPLAKSAGERFWSEAVLFEFRAPGTGIGVALAAAACFWAEHGVDLRQQTLAAHDEVQQLWQFDSRPGGVYHWDRLVVVETERDTPQPGARALERLRSLAGREAGAGLVAEHVRAWDRRWAASGIDLEGDDEARLALRFAAFHLMAAANEDDQRVSLGARGLTGEAYKGHVFWDTEIFMLPFFVYTQPAAARAMLMYRFHTLAGAREKARHHGYRGAMYAWESAADGQETTPPWGMLPDGTLIRILCGEFEQHISADVAYAVWQYWQATADERFFLEAGAEIVLETARFWSSRVALGPDGQYHIRHVIGPDEYHEGVDDNAFTNVMAQWNLARGLETAALLRERFEGRGEELLSRLALGPEELAQWQAVCRGMYCGFDPQSGLIEQFAGFFQLDQIDLAAYQPRTAPLDVILGRERTQRAQVVKQADVVMLLALLWDQFPPAVREANFRYYEPRTGHGSSLSPAIHSLVAARLGDLPLALRYFRQAAAIDLADNMGNAAGGVHAAALGGLWQAAVLGFAGMRLRGDGLSFDPRLPADWRRLEVPLSFRGQRLLVVVDPSERSVQVTAQGAGPVRVAVEGGPETRAAAGQTLKVRQDEHGWQSWREVA